MKKIIALTLAILTLCLCFASCGAPKAAHAYPTKDFNYKNELTITLTEGFVDQNWSDEYSAQYIAADDTTCTIYTVKLHLYEGIENIDEMITYRRTEILGESMYDQCSDIQESSIGVKFFTYRTISADTIHFISYVANEGDMYRVEFWCDGEKHEEFKPFFTTWVASISFDN